MKNTLIAFCLGLMLVLLGAYIVKSLDDQLLVVTDDEETGEDDVLPSRFIMEKAQDIVRDQKPTPPASSRYYAYVASVYADALNATQSASEAQIAAFRMIDMLYPAKAASTSAWAVERNLSKEVVLSKTAEDVLARYIEQASNDKNKSDAPERPLGEPYWVGENPFEPTAGNWTRWIVHEASFTLPPPPEHMSDVHVEGLEMVHQSALARSSEQGAKVNFWGGVPGTEAPAGIWQNRLHDVTKDDHLTDGQYAFIQKILAQSLADSFMECWKIKYIYWTKRPSMVNGSIQLAMENPPFPSYPSGHSTISYTAAEVLAVLLPEHADTWFRDAEEAKNSRLWAGIHYPYDNENGADLGGQIGKTIVQDLKLSAVK